MDLLFSRLRVFFVLVPIGSFQSPGPGCPWCVHVSTPPSPQDRLGVVCVWEAFSFEGNHRVIDIHVWGGIGVWGDVVVQGVIDIVWGDIVVQGVINIIWGAIDVQGVVIHIWCGVDARLG